MNIFKAIEVLSLHNEWRKGANIEMQKPTEIGEAIEIAVNLMKGYIPRKETKEKEKP